MQKKSKLCNNRPGETYAEANVHLEPHDYQINNVVYSVIQCTCILEIRVSQNLARPWGGGGTHKGVGGQESKEVNHVTGGGGVFALFLVHNHA